MFVPAKAFQPTLMFVRKAWAYLSESPFKFFNLVEAPDLTHKHSIRLEIPAKKNTLAYYNHV